MITSCNFIYSQDLNMNRLLSKRLVERASRHLSIDERLNNGWIINNSLKVDDNYNYIIAKSIKSDSTYFGFVKKLNMSDYKWTWGVIMTENDTTIVVKGDIFERYLANPPRKILPLKYYYPTTSTVHYTGEQHPYPVQMRKFVKYNENGTGYIGFQFVCYEVAPLEEAANHYTGGSFGRLTGGFSYYTTGEVQLGCKYKYDSRPYHAKLRMDFDGSKSTKAPVSKLDLSKKKLDNLSDWGNYKKQVVRQIKADFPTNFYVKQTKAGFKELYSCVEPVIGSSTHVLLYSDEKYQFLISLDRNLYDIRSYGFVYRNPEDATELNLGRDICFAWLLNTIKELYP